MKYLTIIAGAFLIGGCQETDEINDKKSEVESFSEQVSRKALEQKQFSRRELGELGIDWNSLSKQELDRKVREIAENMHGEDFESVWALVMSLPSDSPSVKHAKRLAIQKACQVGLVDTVLESVLQSIGPGKQREELIEITFMGGRNFMSSDEAVRLLESLEFPQEERAAQNGLIFHLSGMDKSSSIVEFLNSDNPVLQEAAGKAVGNFPTAIIPRDIDVFSSRLNQALDTLNEFPSLDKRLTIDEVVTWVEDGQEAFVVYDAIEGLLDENGKILDLGNQKEELVKKMVLREPIKTMQKLLGNGSEGQLVEIAFENWLNNDINSAAKWFGDHASTLELRDRDRVHVAFVNVSIDLGELDRAREWAEEISNSKQKSSLLSKIERNSEKRK
ncbi:MAG: hypothetical protein ABF334_06380 [Akkermansiaceae bacterium]